jgi:hypothetical protein
VRSRKEDRSFGYGGGFGVVDTTKNLRERESEREEGMLVRKEFLSCLVKKKKKRIGRKFLFTNWMQREDHRIVFWSHKTFPLCQGFQRKGNGFFIAAGSAIA